MEKANESSLVVPACHSTNPPGTDLEAEPDPRRARRERIAKAICATCPVIKECREQALRLAEPYGIWGGLTEEERFQILSSRINKNINLIA